MSIAGWLGDLLHISVTSSLDCGGWNSHFLEHGWSLRQKENREEYSSPEASMHEGYDR